MTALPHLINFHDPKNCDHADETGPCLGVGIAHPPNCAPDPSACPVERAMYDRGVEEMPQHLGTYECGTGLNGGVSINRPFDPNDWTKLTHKVIVRRERAAEWMTGRRPLPGGASGTDRDYFDGLVDRQAIDRDEAERLLTRHQELSAIGDGVFRCNTCNGTPPPGFTCQSCGRGTQ